MVFMPANIFGERFYGRRQPAWHGIGTVMNEDLTVTQAMAHVDVDFKIFTAPTFAYIESEDIYVPTTHNAIVREPTTDDPENRILSVVGNQWTPIQTRELAEMLDPISEQYPVETIGALEYGKKIFITLDAGQAEIAGEEHNLFYLVTDHRDGAGALSIAFTPVRVVCQNTLTTGLRQAKISATLRHNRAIKADTSWYIKLFNDMLNSQDQVVAQMDRLSHFEIDTQDVDNVLKMSYPDPSAPRKLRLSKELTADDVSASAWTRISNDTKYEREEWEKRKEAKDRIRDTARSRFHVFNDEQPRLANTPWALWQAIVEVEDYRKGWANNASSVLFGERASIKAKAFDACLALCK